MPPFNRHASVFLSSGKTRIGSVYKKALYRQYTDGSYSEEIAKPAWLGFLGPILRAEVGDVIEVHMKNFATRSYSLHPHGVFYEKNSEGWICIISLLVPLLVLLFPPSHSFC
uniref:Plastocyanin-like domain-containing protein n=1 Tax=Sinocyclocheilus rhinocerous TaxID=307959 RepID=A0A673FZ80_9TELE